MTTLLDAPPDRPPAAPRPGCRPLLLAGAAGLAVVLLLAALLQSQRSSTDSAASTADSAAGSAEPAVGAAPPDSVVGKDEAAPGSLGRVVKTGSIALVARDGGGSALLDAVQRAAAEAGGQVFSSSTQESAERPSGTVVVRVPADRFEVLVLAVRGLAEVASASSSGRDVTTETADLDAQVRSLTAARERFLTILGRADTVAEVLSVQQQVDSVTGRLDSLTAQARVLAEAADFSTLTVDVAEEGDAFRPADEPGLGAALRDARDGFVDGVEVLVRLSGPALLLALCLAGLLGAVRLGQRLRRPAA